MRFLFLLICWLFISSCAVNPVTGKQELALLSEADEISLGRKTHREVLKQYSVYENPALQKYVQTIGTKLAEKSHRNELVYRFTVLDSKEVNAFALPGGYIYITRGLMAYLKSEAELAAVLGHEIGHVTARHSVRQYSANQLANIGLTLATALVPGMDQASNQLARLFGAALLRGYGREHELEADRLGAEYLARTDYNPQAMLDVIRVLKDQEVFERELARAEGREARIYHGVFSTHPDNDTRLRQVVGTAQALMDGHATRFVGHETYLALIDDMVYGDSPREGILRGRDFFHHGLNFSMHFPENWTVSNRPDVVSITAPGGEALIQISVEDINKKLSPREFMVERMGLRNLKHESALTVNGLPAHTALSVVNTEQGQRPARITVIFLEQRACIIGGVTKLPEQMVKYDAVIIETARSFHKLTAAEKKLAEPLRLSVVRAEQDTRFVDLAKQSPLETHAESQLRLLNAKYPQGEPETGELLKVIK